MAPLSRILFVIDNLEYGGGERGFLQIIRALAEERWAVVVAAHPGGIFESEARAAGASFAALDMRSRWGLTTIPRLRRLIRAEGVGLVHSQGARADFFARLALVGLPHVQHVCTIQMPVDGFDVSPWRRALYRRLDRWSRGRVDRFIVVSQALRRALVEREGLAPGLVTLIYNGVETSAPASPARPRATAALREELGLGAGDDVIGAVGRLVWQKGFEHLVRAMPHVLARRPGAWLVIVGAGPQRSALEQLAREVGVADHLRFAGFRPDVARVLGAIDLLAVPSVREGFPMITLEAMALGIPIVATAIDGILEQIEHDLEGLLVPPADALALGLSIVALLEDRSLRERLSQAARQRALTAFDVRKTIADTRRVYAELLRAPDATAERAR